MGGGLSALDEATKEGKRPGRKGGEQEKEEGREKPGAAPPGEPRAAAGTFVSAPNSQPGKRELEREEEREGGGKPPRTWEEKKRPPPTCGSPNWSLFQSLTLPGQLTAEVRARPCRCPRL